MGALADKYLTIMGVIAGFFGFRRLQEESAWRSWPTTVGHIIEKPVRGYRVWQSAEVPEGSSLFSHVLYSLPLYTAYRYLARDRPGVFLSVSYAFDTSTASKARAQEILRGQSLPIEGPSFRTGNRFGRTQFRVTRDLMELPIEGQRVAAGSAVVQQATDSLPEGKEVVVHFNPSMPGQNTLSPPPGFPTMTDGEHEGRLVLGAAGILLLIGRRRPLSMMFKRYGL